MALHSQKDEVGWMQVTEKDFACLLQTQKDANAVRSLKAVGALLTVHKVNSSCDCCGVGGISLWKGGLQAGSGMHEG